MFISLRRMNMSDFVIDKEIRRKIIRGTNMCFKKKASDSKVSKSTTLKNIVDIIKSEIKNDAD